MKKTARRQEGIPWIKLGIDLMGAYIVTFVVLLILALLLYKMNLSEKVISGGIVVTYILSCFVAGLFAGKQMKQKRFLWGLIMGLGYYVILLVVSLVINQSFLAIADSMITTLILCAGGGMLGGMLS